MLPSSCRALLGVVALGAAGLVPAQDGERGGRVVAHPQPAPPALARRLHACLIGVASYPAMPRLRTPIQDVRALKALLDSRYGLTPERTVVLEEGDATAPAIVNRLSAYRSLGEDDALLVYYAGHGELLGREGYWQAFDAEPGKEGTWIPNSTVNRILDECPAKHVLLISDSCYSGALRRGGEVVPVPVGEPSKYLTELSRRASRRVLSSGELEPVSDGGYHGHSVFAFHLLQLLQATEAPLVAQVLASDVQKHVGSDRLEKQLPQYGRMPGAADQGGDFVFWPVQARTGAPVKVQEGVPIGWRLPLGVEVEKDATSGRYLYYHRTGRDPSPMVLVVADELPNGFPYQANANDRRLMSKPFLLDEREVAVGRFRRFVQERQPDDLTAWGVQHYDQDEQPVVGVTLRTALEYAAWAGKHVPDEVHWEYAAAWGKGLEPKPAAYRFRPWGGDFVDASFARTTFPQATLPELDVSAWGVRGLASGVREWCVLPIGEGRRDLEGVIRGATQVFSGRVDLRRLTVNEREVAPARGYAAPNLGFRCLMFLER